MHRLVGVLLLACTAVACVPAPAVKPQNVLMIVIDDVGVDSLGVYPVNPRAKSSIATPTLDSLARAGIVFENAWSNPTCSPTRATILTGRYAFRTSVSDLVLERSIHRLPIDEVTIPQVLAGLPDLHAASAAFGKWHLANCLNGGEQHPNLAGFSYFAGQMFNLHAPHSYFYWPKTVNGTTTPTGKYSTTDNVDEASAWIESHAQGGPWFVYLAFNAAHWGPDSIWQVPPHDLLPNGGRGLPREGTHCGEPCRRKMIEAMDHEIGRLLGEIDRHLDDTTIILVGDNGTDPMVQPDGSPYPSSHLKFSLYEGAINVPLIISGAAVAHPGTRSSALVNTSDLFATVIELVSGRPMEAVQPKTALDSTSLVPLLEGTSLRIRDYAFASRHNNEYAIRNTRYKLIRRPEGDQLYDMLTDRHTERNDLLLHGKLDSIEEANHRALSLALDDLIAPARSACPIIAECSDCCADPRSGPARCSTGAGKPASEGLPESCSETARCRFRPAGTPGMQHCLLRDGTSFVCQQGTIHVRTCECGGPGVHCVDIPPAGETSAPPRMSQTLVCR